MSGQQLFTEILEEDKQLKSINYCNETTCKINM